MDFTRRTVLSSFLMLPLGGVKAYAQFDASRTLVTKAREQIGVTTLYDPAYVGLDYPGGDIPRDRGVCIDVVIRAYRDAFDFDFQQYIHEDMRANFGLYPKIWGLTRTDRNIDHRRVPNIETWLQRHGHELTAKDWQPGDLITCRVGGSLPHIGIVSDSRDFQGRFKAIHNIGLGTLEDNGIWSYGQKRRFRFISA